MLNNTKRTNLSRQNEVRDTSNEPAYRITDPMKIGASITVLPPEGGIFCCGGADSLLVGQDIKKTAGWKVYYVEKQGVPEVEVSPALWDVMNDPPSIPCVLRVSIVANIPGREPLQTTREVTFMNVDAGKANEPIEFVTGPNLPGAYVGGKYKAYVCARLGSGYTGLKWNMDGAPDWLRLEPAVAMDGLQRIALVGDPEESWQGKITISATATGCPEIDAPSIVKDFSLLCLYTPSPRILTTDLGTWEDQRYREVQLESFVPVASTDLRWAVSPKLPDGLTLDPKTGLISGVPDKITETYSMEHEFLLHANGLQAQKRLVVLVYPSLQITTPTQLPDLTVGTEYEVQLEVFGAQGSIPPRWVSVLADMPQGIQLSEDGKLHTVSGVPGPTVGEYTFRIGVTDGFGRGITKIMRLECVPTSHIVSRELSSGVVGTEYRTMIQSTGTGGLVLKSGSLPSGLRLSAPESSTYGTISGVPLYSGTYEFVLSLGTDGKHTRSFSIVISEPPMFREEKTLPSAMKDVRYSHRIAASGSPTLEFSDPHHSVPAGLTLDPQTGLISGTPTDPKEYAVDLGVSSVHGHDVATPSMRVRSPIVITTDSLPTAHSSMEYSAQLTAEGLGEGDVWEAAGLPAGLTLNSKTGLISGVPTDSAEDVRDCIVTITIFTPEDALFQKQLILGLNRNPEELPSILPETLPDGYTGEDYEQQFTLKNAPEGSDVFWSRQKATPLPAGFSLDAWTGVMTGRGGSEESETAFTLMASIVEDGKPPRLYATRDYTLKIVERPPVPTIMPETLRPARVQEAYSTQLSLENFEEDGPVHWGILEPGQAPSWMQLDMFSGAISGTPDSEGMHNFRVWAYRQHDEKLEAIAYRDYALECVVAPVILPETLPEGKTGETYPAVQLTLSVPKPAGYDWLLFPHAPDWLELNPETGVLSGKAAAVYRAEPYNVSVVVATHFGSDVEDIFASKVFSLKITKNVEITTGDELPPAVAGAQYTGVKLTMDPPNPKYLWTLETETYGFSWLDVNLETGELFGVPRAADEDYDVSFDALVKDERAEDILARKRLRLHVKAVGGAPAILPVPAQLDQGRVGLAYSEDFRVANSPVDKPYFTISATPAGMRFDEVRGTLSGTPTAPTSAPIEFTISAYEDATKEKDPIATRDYALTVKPAPVLEGGSELPRFLPGVQYSHELTATGLDANAVWNVSGLPEALAFDSTTHKIEGLEGLHDSYYVERHYFVDVTVRNPDDGSSATKRYDLYSGPEARLDIEYLPPAYVATDYPATALQVLGKDGARLSDWIVSSPDLPSNLKIENNVLKGRHAALDGRAGPEEESFTLNLTAPGGTGPTAKQIAFISAANTSLMEWGSIATAPTLPAIQHGSERVYKLELTPIQGIADANWRLDQSEQADVYTAGIEKTGDYTADLTVRALGTEEIRLTVQCQFKRTDKEGEPTKTATQNFKAAVIPSTPVPAIITQSLPPVYEGLEYSVTLDAGSTESSAPLTWSATGLPAGLTLDPVSGVLFGRISREAAGKTHPVTVTATNKFGMGAKSFALVAGGDTDGPLRFREDSLPAPFHDAPYSAFVTLLGHLVLESVEWSCDGLPSGLTAAGAADNPRICQIRGTATDTEGKNVFTISLGARVGDATYTRKYTMSWNAAPALRGGTPGFEATYRPTSTGTSGETVEKPGYTAEARKIPTADGGEGNKEMETATGEGGAAPFSASQENITADDGSKKKDEDKYTLMEEEAESTPEFVPHENRPLDSPQPETQKTDSEEQAQNDDGDGGGGEGDDNPHDPSNDDKVDDKEDAGVKKSGTQIPLKSFVEDPENPEEKNPENKEEEPKNPEEENQEPQAEQGVSEPVKQEEKEPEPEPEGENPEEKQDEPQNQEENPEVSEVIERGEFPHDEPITPHEDKYDRDDDDDNASIYHSAMMGGEQRDEPQNPQEDLAFSELVKQDDTNFPESSILDGEKVDEENNENVNAEVDNGDKEDDTEKVSEPTESKKNQGSE